MQNKNIKDLSQWYLESLHDEAFWSSLVEADVLRSARIFDVWMQIEREKESCKT
jgi:hypothetical protein